MRRYALLTGEHPFMEEFPFTPEAYFTAVRTRTFRRAPVEDLPARTSPSACYPCARNDALIQWHLLEMIHKYSGTC